MKKMMNIHISRFLFLIVFTFSSVVVLAENVGLGPDAWPVTIESAVKDLLSTMSDENKQLVKDTTKENLIRFHFGWGRSIRNHYGMWRGNDELIKAACGKPCHPDDASMVIIEAVWKALRR